MDVDGFHLFKESLDIDDQDEIIPGIKIDIEDEVEK